MNLGTAAIIQQPGCDTNAIVEALPSEGNIFIGWTENGVLVSTDNPYSFALTDYCNLIANFGPMGVNDNEGMRISIYPNPTNGCFTIEGEGIQKVEVSNTLGQCVASQQCEGQLTSIDVTSLPAGLYMVSITDEWGRHCMKKVVVE